MIMRKVTPWIPGRGVILAHRAPLTRRQIGAPKPPALRALFVLLQSFEFEIARVAHNCAAAEDERSGIYPNANWRVGRAAQRQPRPFTSSTRASVKRTGCAGVIRMCDPHLTGSHARTLHNALGLKDRTRSLLASCPARAR